MMPQGNHLVASGDILCGGGPPLRILSQAALATDREAAGVLGQPPDMQRVLNGSGSGGFGPDVKVLLSGAEMLHMPLVGVEQELNDPPYAHGPPPPPVAMGNLLLPPPPPPPPPTPLESQGATDREESQEEPAAMEQSDTEDADDQLLQASQNLHMLATMAASSMQPRMI